MKKYFYEKSDVLSWPSNITYGELQRIIKGLPDLSDSSLKLYDNIWKGNI